MEPPVRVGYLVQVELQVYLVQVELLVLLDQAEHQVLPV